MWWYNDDDTQVATSFWHWKSAKQLVGRTQPAGDHDDRDDHDDDDHDDCDDHYEVDVDNYNDNAGKQLNCKVGWVWDDDNGGKHDGGLGEYPLSIFLIF